MNRRPGGRLASRPLHFIWILDCSGSMKIDGKIEALNTAIREALPHVRATANQNPEAEVLLRAITFSSGAQWHVAQATPIEEFLWTDLTAEGHTDLGKALTMVAEEMTIPPMPQTALPPALVLISDGQPTDDYGTGLKALMATPWGKRAVRLAIAIGRDASYSTLQRFIGNDEIHPVQADSPEAIVEALRFASTMAIQAASRPVGDNIQSQPEVKPDSVMW
jgi:uncharacterized protein YegL